MSIFQENVKKRRNNNQFDLSYDAKLSTQFGQLTPFYLEETLPGDRVKLSSEIKTELAPLLSDLNHLIDVHIDYFYVTYDSIWDNFRDFISGGEKNDQSPTLPYIELNETNKSFFKTGTLADYFGIPCWDKNATAPTITGTRQLNALPFKAYQHIFNHWYRDQDLENEVDIEKGVDGLMTISAMATLRRAAWQDLFTTCRPEAQKGDPVNFLAREAAGDPTHRTWNDTNISPGAPTLNGAGTTTTLADAYMASSTGQALDLYATVAQLRKGEALQRFYEAMQRGGNRYNEYLNSMWGVDDQDSRLHMPQLIHSSDHPLKISEVITTTNADNTTTDDNTAGQAYGRATAYGQGHVNFTAPDYGVIIGIVKFQPRSAYMTPLREYWTRTDRLEWYTDHLAEIGEAPVYNRELYTDVTDPANSDGDLEFGYHHRYHGFKQRHDQISGDFKYGLNYRHIARDIGATPALNSSFVKIGATAYDQTTLTRIFNVIDPNLDYIWLHVYNDATYSRDVKYNSTPLN